MLETAVVAFTTYFAMVSPIEAAVLFAALTPDQTPQARRVMAIKGTLIAAAILLIFALVGEFLLERLGISLAALRASGGILLLLLGIDLVFARSSGGTTATEEERNEAKERTDISVFPLATPLIAGPGSMGVTILLIADAEGDLEKHAAVIGALLVVLGITYLLLLTASHVQRVMGTTGLNVVNRVFGVLVTALAVQFIFDGIKQSGLFTLGT